MMHGAPAGSAKFDALQREKLRAAWLADLPDSTTPHVMIALPSYALDRTIYDHYGDRVPPLEIVTCTRCCEPGSSGLKWCTRSLLRDFESGLPPVSAKGDRLGMPSCPTASRRSARRSAFRTSEPPVVSVLWT